MILRYGGLGSAFAECMGDLCPWADATCGSGCCWPLADLAADPFK